MVVFDSLKVVGLEWVHGRKVKAGLEGCAAATVDGRGLFGRSCDLRMFCCAV